MEARAKLAGAIRRTRPRWLFAPYWMGAHPDHVAATELVEAARFWAKLTKSDLPGLPHYPERIFYYYCLHLHALPQPGLVVDISGHWEGKRAAVACYRSQFLEGRPDDEPTILDHLHHQAAVWGWTIGARYGEPLACREPFGLASLRGLM